MDGDQLLWLPSNPQYVEAVERNLQESTGLAELLERMNWLPRTLEEKEALDLQTAKWKAARAAAKELRETLLASYRPMAGEGRSANEAVPPHAQQHRNQLFRQED
jgi:hypothetical protein